MLNLKKADIEKVCQEQAELDQEQRATTMLYVDTQSQGRTSRQNWCSEKGEPRLKKVNRSEWAAPAFIIPKKDGSVRFISDFRELNKMILRKPYPIPNIQDMLLNLEGFQWATSLDLNMGYYHIR